MGTVVGIIDGTGSLGAAFGQLMVSFQPIKNLQIGLAEQNSSWNTVFIMMSVMIFLSCLPLIRHVKREIAEIFTLNKLSKEMLDQQDERENFSLPA